MMRANQIVGITSDSKMDMIKWQYTCLLEAYY